jgi:pimeloyl-ACP methyl ester carboxylesterase
MLAEARMVLTDPGHRLADRARHTGAGALGGGGGSPAAAAQAEGAGQLPDEEAAFRLGLRGSLGVPAAVDLLRSNPNPVEPAAYDRQAQACLPFDARDRLGGIAAATLVVAGEQDLLTPPLGHTSCRWSARTTSTGW